MITLFSDNETILKEFYEDKRKAIYWHEKQLGTRYAKDLDTLYKITARTMEDQVGRIVDYTSPNGNKWKVFDICRYLGYGKVQVYTSSVLYWNTIGSVGAMVANSDAERIGGRSVLILTNHFFLRLAQRKNTIPDVSLVLALLVQNSSALLEVKEDDEGKPCVDMRVEGGVGRGYVRRMGDRNAALSGSVIEIRTFLNDYELSKPQQRHTKKLREAASFIDNRPLRMQLEEVAQSEEKYTALSDFFEKQFRVKGAPEGFGKFFNKVAWQATNCLLEFMPDITDKGATKLARTFCNVIRDFGESAFDYFQRKGADIKGYEVVEMCYECVPYFDGNKALVNYGAWNMFNKGKSVEEVMQSIEETKRWLKEKNVYLTKDNYREFFREVAQ